MINEKSGKIIFSGMLILIGLFGMLTSCGNKEGEEDVLDAFLSEEDLFALIGSDAEELEIEHLEKGFYFKKESENEGEVREEEVIIRPADLCLEHDSWEETLSYFAGEYPEMYSLKVSLYGRNTLWEFEGETLGDIFLEVKDVEGTHGFLTWNEEICEVFSRGTENYYNMVDTVRSNAGYDYDSCFLWEQEEDGNITWEDNLEGSFFYVRDLGNGEIVRFRIQIAGKEAGEFVDTITYKVELYDEKENRLLQEIQVDSSFAHESPFEFEDFNADGYLDLTVIYYYGANGGTASHYIFSPSKKQFLKLDSELDYYGMYSVDDETRRLYMHYHGSAISGTETTYQWKNEMDYEKIRQFDHDTTEGGVQVTVTRYENGTEEILSDFEYSLEEYMARPDLWGMYYEDFLWEKEVTDQATGQKYMLRYAEVYWPEEAAKNQGIYYDGRIYVYDEDTYLISVIHSEIISQSDSIVWEDGSDGKEQALVINYVDGGRSAYYLSGLIIPDYQQQE